MSGLIMAAGIAALVVAAPAFAATWTWTGGSGNDHWTNTPNWNPISTPANDGTANIIFGGFTRPTPDMNANWNVKSVTFNNTAGQFFLDSTTNSILTIGAGGITDNSTFDQNINYEIDLSARRRRGMPLPAASVSSR